MPEPVKEVTATTKQYRFIWAFILIAAIITELLALPKGHRDTLSETVWDTVRWTHWRLLLLPTWTWLSWHWILRREQVIDWRDGVALAIGLVWAIIEIWYKR